MAVWGIGAYYNDSETRDKTQDFLDRSFAYIGWKEPEAPAIYQMLRSIKVGDIIYIKSFSPKTKTLHIKALGIVIDNKLQYSEDLGTGVAVKWKDEFTEVIEISITPEMYRNNIYNNSLYEEYDKRIIQKLIEEIMK